MLRLAGRIETVASWQLVAGTRSLSSSRGPPPAAKRLGFSIPAQGFVFSALLIPVLGYTLYAGSFGLSEEELEHQVRERYAERIAEQRPQSAAMADFFQHAIHKPDGSVDETFQQVLYAGRGGKKRIYAVDEKLYGTEEGVAEKKRQEEEQKKRQEYRRKKKAGEIVDDEQTKKSKSSSGASKNETPKADVTPTPGGMVINTQSAATMGAVALLAAGVGFLAGGSRRS